MARSASSPRRRWKRARRSSCHQCACWLLAIYPHQRTIPPHHCTLGRHPFNRSVDATLPFASVPWRIIVNLATRETSFPIVHSRLKVLVRSEHPRCFRQNRQSQAAEAPLHTPQRDPFPHASRPLLSSTVRRHLNTTALTPPHAR